MYLTSRFLQASSKNAVLAIVDKARESCVMIQDAKKAKTTKPKKSSASGSTANAVDVDLKDVKISIDEPKKSKQSENKKTTKKVLKFLVDCV